MQWNVKLISRVHLIWYVLSCTIHFIFITILLLCLAFKQVRRLKSRQQERKVGLFFLESYLVTETDKDLHFSLFIAQSYHESLLWSFLSFIQPDRIFVFVWKITSWTFSKDPHFGFGTTWGWRNDEVSHSHLHKQAFRTRSVKSKR